MWGKITTRRLIILIFHLMSRDIHNLNLGYNSLMKTKFEERYTMLNHEQKKAVDAIDGPVMVVAGPGTGKTQILTLRIANIISKTDTEPENILALTFTDSGVHAMRKRLAEMIGSSAYRVGIYTFHSFSNDVIQNNPEEFPRIIGSKAITDVDQIAIIESIITSSELPLLKPFGDSFYYVRTILQKISDLKREGVTPYEFKKIIEKEQKLFENDDEKFHTKGKYAGKMKSAYADKEKVIKKNRELVYVYESYQEELAARKMYDFNDMIVEVLQALRTNQDLLLRLQEKHQYILVDEHQDTNNAQNKILELLANFHDNPNLFVVGDEKQSIYRFQGASIENFFYFKHLYPQAELITLKQNYRSTQSILDGAHSLLPGDSELLANTSFESKLISLVSLENTSQELVWLAEKIESLVQEGVDPHEIAILYRNNHHAFPVIDILSKKGIPAVIESDQNLFEDKDIIQFLDILEAVQHAEKNEVLAKILFSDVFSLDTLLVTRLVRAASQKRKRLLIELLCDAKSLKEEGFKDTEQEGFLELGNNLMVWKRGAENELLIETLENIMRESGYLQYLLASPNGTAKVETLGILFDEARSFLLRNEKAKLADFLEYLARLKEHNISIKKKVGRIKEGMVRLMTAHRSKGLEFDYVFIIGVNDGVWGNQTKRELLPLLPEVYTLFEKVKLEELSEISGDAMEERRVFYVALTRARKHVTISYVLQREDGKEMLPSQFVGEIKQELVTFEDTENFVHAWPEKQLVLFDKRIKESVSGDEYKEQMKAFVKEKLLSQGLSVSALNNYLKSPWLFFFRNLLRIPSSMNKSLVFGNAVHGALQTFFNNARGEKYPTLEFLLGSFTQSLESQDYAEKDFNDLTKKGNAVLTRWYEEYQGTWNLDTQTEFRINAVSIARDEEELPYLTGVLDKLEFVSSDRTHVVVVDYKTGKPKTEGQIRGTVKDGDGDYYRQLVFYKLLLKYFQGGKMKMDGAVLEFVEPNDKGILKRYEFEIDDEEVEELENTIRKVVSDILNLVFWDEPVSEEAKEYARLVDAVKR